MSSETVSGAEAINEDRAKRGFKPLKLVVVDLVGINCKALGGDKLSSTALRAAEACSNHNNDDKCMNDRTGQHV